MLSITFSKSAVIKSLYSDTEQSNMKSATSASNRECCIVSSESWYSWFIAPFCRRVLNSPGNKPELQHVPKFSGVYKRHFTQRFNGGKSFWDISSMAKKQCMQINRNEESTLHSVRLRLTLRFKLNLLKPLTWCIDEDDLCVPFSNYTQHIA